MIFVPKSIILNPEYTHYDVAVWCYADILIFSLLKEYDLLSSSSIVYQIKGTLDGVRTISEEVTQSLQHLVETDALNGEHVKKQYYVVYKSSFDTHRFVEGFIEVDENDIREIMQRHSRPFATLRHYLLFLATIDNKKKCGIYGNEKLASFLNEDIETITRYFNTLEKMDLLYIYREYVILNRRK